MIVLKPLQRLIFLQTSFSMMGFVILYLCMQLLSVDWYRYFSFVKSIRNNKVVQLKHSVLLFNI